jgi:hypothetical protein
MICYRLIQARRFYGIIINKRAAGRSTVDYNQYTAYKSLFDITPIDTNQEKAVKAMFSISLTTLIGSITILTPISQCKFHIVNANTPFLLSLVKIDTKVSLNNVQNKLTSKDRASVPIVRCFSHFLI